jgi:hypothetical protein
VLDLICQDVFRHSNAFTNFDLECYLRCIVAGLRLLSAHGIQNTGGILTLTCLEEMYDRIAMFQQPEGIRGEEAIESYNPQFLIIYARNLIASLSSNRTLAIVGRRLIVSAAVMDHPVSAHDAVLTNSFAKIS